VLFVFHGGLPAVFFGSLSAFTGFRHPKMRCHNPLKPASPTTEQFDANKYDMDPPLPNAKWALFYHLLDICVRSEQSSI